MSAPIIPLKTLQAESILTSHQLATLLQVDPSTINNWARAERLRAYRTPGGHRRFRVDDVLAFLSTYHMPVPDTLAASFRKRLMVVDDDKRQLKALSRVLKPYADRVDVELVGDAIEALVRVGSFLPHVLVLDAQLSDLDGIAACQKLKSLEAAHSIRVIVACNEVTPEIEERAKAAGASRCLPKPLDHRTLLADIGVE
jgi:excisionase family DNA binding protein